MALQKSFKDSSGDNYPQGYHRISHLDIYLDEKEIYITGKTYKNANHRNKENLENDKPEQMFTIPAANTTDFKQDLDNLIKKIYPWIKENDDRFEGATDV